MEEYAYRCDKCERVLEGTSEKGPAPFCCGREMSLLPLRECGKDPSFVEHARFQDDDQPCDPGLG